MAGRAARACVVGLAAGASRRARRGSATPRAYDPPPTAAARQEAQPPPLGALATGDAASPNRRAFVGAGVSTSLRLLLPALMLVLGGGLLPGVSVAAAPPGLAESSVSLL